MSNEFWKNKIKAFLHDPPDKALKIQNHESRRDQLLQVLGLKFDISPEFDWIASSMERFVPKVDVYIDFSRTDRTFHPIIKHPITGREKKFESLSESVLGLKKTRVDEILDKVLSKEKEILDRLKDKDPKVAYFRIWRLMRDLIEDEELVNLPADTRCPDHTIWDHLDASSAIYGAMSKGTPALMMFKLTPVQDFIKNARKEKDLWAGSHLLSYLTFQAIKVVVDEFGPDAVVFPHLRGQPFFDWTYRQMFTDFIDLENLKVKLGIANIPNKFLAIVNFESVEESKRRIKDKIDKILKELLDFSLKTFGNRINEHMKNHYLRIVQNYFNITICAIPADLNGLMKIIEDLPNGVKEKYRDWLDLLNLCGQNPKIFDLYSLMFELLEEIVAIESRKFTKPEGEKAFKCSLCGEIEAIWGKNYDNMRKKWYDLHVKNPTLIKSNECLCPVCLTKRMYPEWIKERFGIGVGFESVSKVALNKQIKNAKVTFYDLLTKKDYAKKLGLEIEHSTYWSNVSEILNAFCLKHDEELFYKENLSDVRSFAKAIGLSEKELKKKVPNADKFINNTRKAIKSIERKVGELPKYYAILIMDGDDMGKMLVGDEMKPVKDYLHPKVVNTLPQDVKSKVEKTRRLITPATHSAISRALAHFSVNIVPNIVEGNRGELIYAGGDDVLALLPIDSALACAYQIQSEFRKDWDGWNVLPAKTMSAGILIVHYKHPLYDALDKARELERKAKEFGRDCVAIGFLKRNGSYDEVVFNWDVIPKIGKFVELLKNSNEKEIRDGKKPSLSRIIIYDVVSEIEKLPKDENAIKAYLKFEFSRHYRGDEKEDELVEEVMDIAKHIRVTITKDDFERLENLKRSQFDKVNSKINELIRSGELSAARICDELKDVLDVSSFEFYEKLYGLILKKQVKGLFILLKILLDCDADLRGVCRENSDET